MKEGREEGRKEGINVMGADCFKRKNTKCNYSGFRENTPIDRVFFFFFFFETQVLNQIPELRFQKR